MRRQGHTVTRNAECCERGRCDRRATREQKQRSASSLTGRRGRRTQLRVVMRNSLGGCRSRGWRSQRRIHEDENMRPICSSALCSRKRYPQHRHGRRATELVRLEYQFSVATDSTAMRTGCQGCEQLKGGLRGDGSRTCRRRALWLSGDEQPVTRVTGRTRVTRAMLRRLPAGEARWGFLERQASGGVLRVKCLLPVPPSISYPV